MELKNIRKKREVTKHPVGLKLTALGIQLLDRMSLRHAGTPLQENKGHIVDRLILSEAEAIRTKDKEIHSLLKDSGL